MTENEPRRRESEDQDELTADEAFMQVFGDDLWSAAKKNYEEFGRGAVVVDPNLRRKSKEDAGCDDYLLRFGYLELCHVEEMGDANLIGKVRTYNPATEFIALFLRPGRTTSYRVVPDEDPTK